MNTFYQQIGIKIWKQDGYKMNKHNYINVDFPESEWYFKLLYDLILTVSFKNLNVYNSFN